MDVLVWCHSCVQKHTWSFSSHTSLWPPPCQTSCVLWIICPRWRRYKQHDAGRRSHVYTDPQFFTRSLHGTVLDNCSRRVEKRSLMSSATLGCFCIADVKDGRGLQTEHQHEKHPERNRRVPHGVSGELQDPCYHHVLSC